MIIIKAPLRITFAGGGTDLKGYYTRFGGRWISAAISPSISITASRTFEKEYILKYSKIERVKSSSEIVHPILRKAIEKLKIDPGIEIVSFADIPSGTGLGGSGAFGVALVSALLKFKGESRSPEKIADLACEIEMEDLGEPSGKQDPWIASMGGIKRFQVDQAGKVTVEDIELSYSQRDLSEHMALYFTGYVRDSNRVLTSQASQVESLHQSASWVDPTIAALKSRDFKELGAIFSEHWKQKRVRSEWISNPKIDHYFNEGLEAGAWGGKLVGAGGGGFLVFVTPDKSQLDRKMSALGLRHVPFSITRRGVDLE